MPRMKGYAALCFVIACSPDHHHTGVDAPRGPDATPADASLSVCRATAGTAAVTANDHGALQMWTRLHAGGLWFSGPVAVAGPPMQISLWFTDADPLDSNVGYCCSSPNSTCCNVDGVFAQTQAIPDGAELGQHPITITGFRNSTFMFDGTLTITYFIEPFVSAPGRITGSISGSVAGQSISGQFDNTFCTALTATI
jgi:hypothetical protein